MFRIWVNQALICFRKRKRAVLSIEQMLGNEGGWRAFDIPENRPGPEQQVSDFEVSSEIRRAVVRSCAPGKLSALGMGKETALPPFGETGR